MRDVWVFVRWVSGTPEGPETSLEWRRSVGRPGRRDEVLVGSWDPRRD